MPAAFYEFNIEQSSTFLSALRILKPDGSLFKFVPNVGETFWADSTTLNFNIPEEIKTLYPDDNNSFGYLKNTTTTTDFLTLRMQIKDPSNSANSVKIQGKIKCTSVNGVVTIATETPTGSIKEAIFSFPRPIIDHNILLNIPSNNTNFKGKYFYDLELEYKIGATTSSTQNYVIRLMQGKVTFNPNITTLT